MQCVIDFEDIDAFTIFLNFYKNNSKKIKIIDQKTSFQIQEQIESEATQEKLREEEILAQDQLLKDSKRAGFTAKKKILELLKDDAMWADQLAENVGLPRRNIYAHINKLRDANLIEQLGNRKWRLKNVA